ncbi:integrase catalytic domain-containing protein [Trichonephila clavipes]|uniref:Integrase catalytic domain-containing protein n=1 Tax=Trichonephila clavipes TaxID=2585209 RepID=A0A8X6V138_TRICX|nr:integrase catalytic domain-containing protein [Trichonephila clavipes]
MIETNCTQEAYNIEFEAIEGYTEKMIAWQVRVKNIMKTDALGQKDNHSLVTSSSSSLRLPKIQFQQFSGELTDWLRFHNQFKRIHEDESIDDGDKFQYLIQATTPKSRARDIVESFPATPENYRKAFEYLRMRFVQEDVLIQVYVRELLKLVLQNTEVKKVNLSSLYDKIEAQLRALESLGVTKEKYAAMLFPLVESCLPSEILRAWERYVGYSSDESGLETESASIENSTTASSSSSNVLANQACTSEVLLQTLVVMLQNGNHKSLVRALIDTGSQKSYILKSTAENLGFKYEREEEFVHSLFGGSKTKMYRHKCYNICLTDIDNYYTCNLNAKLAENRLESTKRKLIATGKFEEYQDVLDLWLSGKIIEEVNDDKENFVHYLPHRPVIKESSTNILNQVKKWLEQLPILASIKIPRCLNLSSNGIKRLTLHVFCDASKKAYAACVFLRVEYEGNVFVKLIQAKTRVAPLKDISIPRLELLACVWGTRLAASVKNDLNLPDVRIYYLTDSMTALAWIQRTRDWGVFVSNRVKEIRNLSDFSSWEHVPSEKNFADILSRGCNAEQLVYLRWWEGPSWLSETPVQCPRSKQVPDEEAVNLELRKSVLVNTAKRIEEFNWHSQYFSSYLKVVRMIACIFRFFKNAKRIDVCNTSEITFSEFDHAEKTVIKLIQMEKFEGVTDEKLRPLKPFLDEFEILRARTKLSFREDTHNFKFPIILPNEHPVVHLMIVRKHEELMHAGVDLAGPLHLKDRRKGWVVLFTCAVFRAVHFELITSLSTAAFLQSLRRFISRRGRPTIIYSDNGTNFVGSNSALNSIDWDAVISKANIQKIKWKFNPPSAAWWGGFWERMIQMLKQILRKMLGRASLYYEELNTVLCECEHVINSRPLTYISEDVNDLSPLTPAMLLQEIETSDVTDIDCLDHQEINKRGLDMFKPFGNSLGKDFELST